jgi:transmembrane sensor
MTDLFGRIQSAWLEIQAARWVMRIDQDKDGNEAGLRAWVGENTSRADAYNRARRASDRAPFPARKIYGTAAQRGVPVRVADPRAQRKKLIFATAFSLALTSIAIYFVLTRLNILVQYPNGSGSLEQLYSTQIGEVRPVQLADGSQLLLDTDSAVRVNLSDSSRQVLMIRGRVRFSVAHDASRPFSVRVGNATITDRGTIFDVEAYRDVRVRLIAGAIDVAFKRVTKSGEAQPIRLHAGQQIRFDPTLTAPIVPPTVTPVSDVQWVTGLKTFDDVQVSDILDEVNRYSTTSIVLADPALGTHHVFLDLDIRDTQAVARNLALYLQLAVDASHPGRLILLAPAKPN